MNMYPDTMTVYRHSIAGNADEYSRRVIRGVYWVETDGVDKEGKGFTKTREVTVTTSQKLTASYGKEWDIQGQDRIIKGEGGFINSFKDIPDAFAVTAVSKYRCGGKVDNIVIKGV